MFAWDFHNDPLNLISDIDVKTAIERKDFLMRIIDRYNYALKTDGESKFMVLYSILEQVRNEYILSGKIEKDKAGITPNLKKVKEEFSFKIRSKDVDSAIKEILSKIADIVSDEQREQFLQELPSKIGSIKLLTMTNQFKSLFEYLNISPEAFGLDFRKLLALRNSIFHGRPVSDVQYLAEINSYKHLPKFTGVIILNFLGISSFSKYKNRRFSSIPKS
jgi:hypothetical protein